MVQRRLVVFAKGCVSRVELSKLVAGYSISPNTWKQSAMSWPEGGSCYFPSSLTMPLKQVISLECFLYLFSCLVLMCVFSVYAYGNLCHFNFSKITTLVLNKPQCLKIYCIDLSIWWYSASQSWRAIKNRPRKNKSVNRLCCTSFYSRFYVSDIGSQLAGSITVFSGLCEFPQSIRLNHKFNKLTTCIC